MNTTRKILVGAALSVSLMLGAAGTMVANGPMGDHPANPPFGTECVSPMTQMHGGIGRHHQAMGHEGSLGSHLQMMRVDGCEMDMP